MFLRFTFLVFIILILGFATSQAQNNVENGDFETYSECPDDHSQIFRATGWYSYRGTPDYFNGCDTSHLVGTPLNLTHGFQYPLSGNGYGGLIGLAYNNDREIMGTELNTPLTPGQQYYVEFYWSRTFGGSYHSNCDCASSHLGALFTTKAYNNMTDPAPITNFAHVYDPTLLSDSANWVKISGWFTADSAYTHLAIGDFFDLDSNQVAYYNGSADSLLLNTYYYIENVCVATDPALCGLVNAMEVNPQYHVLRLFPNPANTVLNIDTPSDVNSIAIVDINGRVLFKRKDTGQNQIDISHLPDGMYFIVVKTNREWIRKKFIKINTR